MSSLTVAQVEVTERALTYAKAQKAQYSKDTDAYMVWWALEDELERLQAGSRVFEDGSPFACYGTLQDTPLQADFLDAWGAEIGRFGGHVYNLSGVLHDSWKDDA